MTNYIEIISDKLVFNDSEQTAKDLDSLVKGEGMAAVTQTLTNKRITKRVYSVASTATLTPEIDTYDEFEITALAEALNIANHSTSTPVAGDKILIAITPDATPRALTYGTNYVARAGVALPSTTVASKCLTLGFRWNGGLSKYVLLAAGQEA